MANNLVETIQKNLGFPALHKIDPNSQEATAEMPQKPLEKLGQAAIPTTLTALYRYTRTDPGSQNILSGSDHSGWLGVLFEGKQQAAIEKVAAYAGVSLAEAETALKNAADESVMTVRRSAGPNADAKTVRAFMNTQRHHIIVYLPAAMQMGDLLNEETLDDRTNKMEGPVSSFMHKIEDVLSSSDKTKYP
jgi:hypothetical protein